MFYAGHCGRFEPRSRSVCAACLAPHRDAPCERCWYERVHGRCSSSGWGVMEVPASVARAVLGYPCMMPAVAAPGALGHVSTHCTVCVWNTLSKYTCAGGGHDGRGSTGRFVPYNTARGMWWHDHRHIFAVYDAAMRIPNTAAACMPGPPVTASLFPAASSSVLLSIV